MSEKKLDGQSEKILSGQIGEEISALFLKLKGYQIIRRNLRTRKSEIDIIAGKAGSLAFVEVKLRGGDSLSEPVGCLDRKKRERLTKGALFFLQNQPVKSYHTIRFDVVAITYTGERLVAEHIENAFPAEGSLSW